MGSEADDISVPSGNDVVEKNDETTNITSQVQRTFSEGQNLVGKIVHSEQEAYALYCDYGYNLGFSMRRGKESYFIGTKKTRTKEYCCSKEGFKNVKRSNEKSHRRRDIRTGCKAMVRFKVDEQGIWKVVLHVSEHNHEFATPKERHLLRSARLVSPAKGNVLKSMVNAGIRTSDAYSYMAEESGGAENLGFSKKDCYNYLYMQRKAHVEVGDSQSGGLVKNFTIEDENVFRNCAMRYAYELVTMSQGHVEARKCLWEGFSEMYNSIQGILKRPNLDKQSKLNDIEHNKTLNEEEEIRVLDPHCVKPKGISNSRLKGHFELPKKRSSKGEVRKTKSRKIKQVTSSCPLEPTPIVYPPMASQPQFAAVTQPISPKFFQICPNNIYMPPISQPTSNSAPQSISQDPTILNSAATNMPFTSVLQDSCPTSNLSVFGCFFINGTEWNMWGWIGKERKGMEHSSFPLCLEDSLTERNGTCVLPIPPQFWEEQKLGIWGEEGGNNSPFLPFRSYTF